MAFPGCPGQEQAGVGRRGSNPSPPGRGDLDSTFAPRAPKTGAGSPSFTNAPLPGLSRSPAKPAGIPTVPLDRLPPSGFLPAGGSWSPSPAHAHSALRAPERQGPSKQPLPASRAGRAGRVGEGATGGGGSRAQGCSSLLRGPGRRGVHCDDPGIVWKGKDGRPLPCLAPHSLSS